MSNWPLPNPDIQCLLCTLPTKSTGHPIAIMSSHVKKSSKIYLNVRTYLLNAYQFQQQKNVMNPTQSDNNVTQFPIDIYEFNQLLLEVVSLQQVQNKEQYLKDIAYEIKSYLDKAIISILKDNIFWHHLRIIVHILETYLLIPIILESHQATYTNTVYFWARI
ncbi:19105_t:CDS:2 [Gigaspora margarita]|uniref:19105_t:CDS:1 n=1 Tax=Gigaspora margarita TaxID=4874 RepID=A0ABN7UD38_GIGMA|nr:19105_t:CDS:2 [Gigaspora margarita]